MRLGIGQVSLPITTRLLPRQAKVIFEKVKTPMPPGNPKLGTKTTRFLPRQVLRFSAREDDDAPDLSLANAQEGHDGEARNGSPPPAQT